MPFCDRSSIDRLTAEFRKQGDGLATLIRLITSRVVGDLSSMQTIFTLPDDFLDRSNPPELHLASNGKYLFIANRGHHRITGSQVDAEDGTLALPRFHPLPGETIRSFFNDPTSKYLDAGGEGTGNLIMFSIDPSSGSLKQIHVGKANGGIESVVAETLP